MLLNHAFAVYFVNDGCNLLLTMAAFVNDGCNLLLTMAVITKKILMMTTFVTLMAAFVNSKMLMMTANVNDGCNPLLMMVVIIVKMFFQMISICRLIVVCSFTSPFVGW
jgi:hypothetical protein